MLEFFGTGYTQFQEQNNSLKEEYWKFAEKSIINK